MTASKGRRTAQLADGPTGARVRLAKGAVMRLVANGIAPRRRSQARHFKFRERSSGMLTTDIVRVPIGVRRAASQALGSASIAHAV